uniref:Nephrocystin 3-like N-terminal domain-containing protein n=1 Tax=Hyaloperonospora arabidopsidis (strain Emoy2) TaxID=559515 RepID=M4BL19_HYAAE
MHRLKNKLRLHKKDGTWDLDEDSMRLKQNQDHVVRLDRSGTLTDTVNETDDVEEMFYSSTQTRSTNGPPQYRSTEQLPGRLLTLTSLNEDAETPSGGSNASSSFSQFSDHATSISSVNLTSTHHHLTTSTSMMSHPRAVGGASSELEQLRFELIEVKQEVAAIRQHVVNELHVTRYDVLKELALLKGAIAQLTGTFPPPTTSVPLSIQRSVSNPLSSADRGALTRQTSTMTSSATRDRLAASRVNTYKPPPPAARASVRLTQLAPVADSALSTPLSSVQMNDLFPLIDFTTELAAHARRLTPGSRTWALTRAEEWLESRFKAGMDPLLAVVGEGGSGKSAFCGTVAQQYRGQLVAAHCCQFDRKGKSSPRNVLLSVVHQLVVNLPLFKNQLARLNLKYVLEEADPVLLASKVLVDPLNALEDPVDVAFMLVDGIDQCNVGPAGRNELLEFLAQLIPQLPSWLGVIVSSKPSSKLAKRLPVSSVLDFSAKNEAFVADVSSLVDEIACHFKHEDVEEAKEVLKHKSGGNFAYLEFTKQALSGMASVSKEGVVAIDVLRELPETLYDIYAEIFEDKFGHGRARVWSKAEQVLQLAIGATAGPYSPVTEEQAQEHFRLTTEDLRLLRRSFVDLVAVKHGIYRIENSALCAWLCDPARAEEQFYFNIDDALQALRKMRRASASASSGQLTSSGSSNGSAPGRSQSPQKVQTESDCQPVSILKRGRM